ncbi:hypothetical protein [Rhodococcus sp. RS1C4]|nr:hypothetical protein [Rhodococcus sp. RS1C4]
MRNSTKFALTTLAAAALFGTAGAVGTTAASADTIENLTPRRTTRGARVRGMRHEPFTVR